MFGLTVFSKMLSSFTSHSSFFPSSHLVLLPSRFLWFSLPTRNFHPNHFHPPFSPLIYSSHRLLSYKAAHYFPLPLLHSFSSLLDKEAGHKEAQSPFAVSSHEWYGIVSGISLLRACHLLLSWKRLYSTVFFFSDPRVVLSHFLQPFLFTS